MVYLMTQLCKYIMLLLILLYCYCSYAVLTVKRKEIKKRIYRSQLISIFLFQLTAFLVIFMVRREARLLLFYAAQLALLSMILLIYRVLYRRASALLMNHMCILILIGLIMLTRLDEEGALRQLAIAAIAVLLSAFVPLLVQRLNWLKKLTWLYGVFGIAALSEVFVIGQVSGGARLSVTVSGITLQPSELVKLSFVFFTACMLSGRLSPGRILAANIVAAVHVLTLVFSTDLGAALIYFAAYLLMLYVATRDKRVLLSGCLLGGAAAFGAYALFSHVRTRIAAWRDPFFDIYGSSRQMAQSLFAIGTGGWFGMGLYQGAPETIPVGTSDFIFAAICEELGLVFGFCVILICFSCVLFCLRLAIRINDSFYELIALGLGTIYGMQVFLNIGGVIRLIPSTGVTLPLVSSGGSSLLSTMLLFGVLQGIYMMQQNDPEPDERGNEGSEEDSEEASQEGVGA